MTSTVANTKNKVSQLHRRNVNRVTHADGCGQIDFTGQNDAKGVRPGFSSSLKVHPWRRRGAGNTSIRVRSNIGCGTRCIGTDKNGRQVAGQKGTTECSTLRSVAAVPHGRSVAPKGLSSGADKSTTFSGQTQANIAEGLTGESPVGFENKRAVSPEAVVPSAFGGPAVATRDNVLGKSERNGAGRTLHENGTGEEKPSAAVRIGALLSALPLSKLKIVVGKGFQSS